MSLPTVTDRYRIHMRLDATSHIFFYYTFVIFAMDFMVWNKFDGWMDGWMWLDFVET